MARKRQSERNKMEKTYQVRLGGSPPDSAEIYRTKAIAEKAAIRMARIVAENADEDQETIDSIEIWGSEEELDGIGWGACPADDSGCYYPQITVCYYPQITVRKC